jgi:hypothetical protein
MHAVIALLFFGACQAFTTIDCSRTPKRAPSILPAAANNALSGIGLPSNPGWDSVRLNRLTEWADEVQPNRPKSTKAVEGLANEQKSLSICA